MRLDQLNYVYHVSKYGSINETAKHLYISQSTISTAITSLENELGIQIFNRSKNGVSTTELGQSIIENIIPIFEYVGNINQIAANQSQNFKGTLKITAHKDFLHAKNLSVIQKLQNKYPGVDFFLEERRVPRIIESVQSGEINFGFVICERREEDTFCKKLTAAGINYQFLYEDSMQAFCSNVHPLAQKSTITFEELKQYPFVAYSNMCTFPSICDWNRSFNVESTDARKKLLLNNHTDLSLIYTSSLKDDIYFDSGQLVKLNVIDLDLPCSVWAIYRKGTILSFIEKELLELYK